MADPKAKPLSFWPLLGFINSIPRNLVPFAAFTSRSLNWLVGNQRLLRRSGSTTQVTGVLESSWSALAKRIMPFASPSLTNGFPTWLALYVNESTKMAQLAFRSTNGTPATRVLGSDFGAYSYGWPTTRTDGVPTFRVMPHVYENEYGGLTLARLNNEKSRRFLCGGSRDVILHGRDVAWGGYTSAPGKWGGRFNDSAVTGDEPTEVFPLGMIPPLQMPIVSTGNDLGASAVSGPWRGSDAFFFSVDFENEAGEISRGPIPRPPNSVAVGYVGFGYCQVSSAQPTHYFDSLIFSGIPIGPPGTVRRRIRRSTKVTIDTTPLSPFPSALKLYWCATINNTDTTYTLRDGSDDSLDTSPIPQETLKLVWPPRARSIGRFDGRALLGCLRPNPYAILAAPWANGSVNAPVDDASLYTGDDYSVAVTPTQLLLRKVSSGVVAETAVDIGAHTLEDIVDLVSVNQTYTTITRSCTYLKGSSLLTYTPIDGDVYPGDTVVSADWPVGTRVVSVTTGGAYQYVYVNTEAINGAVHANVDFNHGAIDTADPAPWAVGVVPGADMLAAADSLLRTKVDDTIQTHGNNLVDLSSVSLAKYVTPGMFVSCAQFAAGTEVTEVNETTGVVTLSTSAGVSTSASATFYYDTGDGSRDADLQALRAVTNVSYDPTATGAIWTGLNKVIPVADWGDGVHGWGLSFTAPALPDPSYRATAKFSVTTAVAPSTRISFVRITIRARCTVSVGTPKAYVYPFVGTDDMMLDTSTFPPAQELTGSFEDYVFNMPYYPGAFGWFSGTDWTAGIINSAAFGPEILVVPDAAGDVIDTFVYDFNVEIVGPSGAVYPGYVRTYGNAFPVALPFSKAYLDQFQPSKSAVMFTGASPGNAQDAINTWPVGNRRSGPTSFGELMGFADMGPMAFVFFARARMRLWNPRTGLTHADDDYNLTTSSWTRGARSPYCICAGNQWCIFLADEGLFAVGVQISLSEYRGDVMASDTAEVLISKNIYDAERAPGQRGELEYAIAACVASSESGGSHYPLSAEVIGGLLYVHYWSSADAGYHDREIRYDFSMGSGRTGLAEVLDDNGQPYPWSCPCDLRGACSAKVVQADGAIHRYAAVDSNDGATDGRVDELDTGTTDNGEVVEAEGNSGLRYAVGVNLVQALVLRSIFTKRPSAGVSIGVALNPERDPEDSGAEFEDHPMAPLVMDDFGRAVVQTDTEGARGKAALAIRVLDDGTGPPTEITQLIVDTVDTPSVGVDR